jgi:hypothetical protein
MGCIHLFSPQGTEKWLDDRKGLITASMFTEVKTRLKSGPNKGDFSQKAKDYAFKLAYERVSGELLEDPQFNPWQSKRGQALEEFARLAYEKKYGVLVEQTGLAVTEDKIFGSSVDGLVDEDGNIEIKCFLAPAKLASILFDENIGDCMDQVQGGLWITGRKWCDFILYCPALRPIDRELTVIRVYRDEEYIYQLELNLIEFNRLVDEYVQKLSKKAVEIKHEPKTEESAVGIFGSH